MAATLHEREDLLPWSLRTRKRGSTSNAIVAVNHGAELAVCAAAPPPERRLIVVVGAQNDVANEFICSICGRGFGSSRAMGGHKSHHSVSEKEGGGSDEGAAAVVYELPPRRRRRYGGARRRCERCGRTFVNGQGLGGHRRYCKGSRPPPPAASPVEMEDGGGGGGGVVHSFDLNELPPPEEDDKLLALPWYENGAPEL